MKMEMNERLEEYLDLFETVKARVGDEQVACEIINQVGKDGRCEKMQGSRRSTVNASDDGNEIPATSKQIGYLKRLGVAVPEGVTKYQASELRRRACPTPPPS